MPLHKLWSEVTRVRAHAFDFLILFVTGQCNAQCQHCFYWENLGPKHAGLDLDTVTRIASSTPPFRTLLLSGGEPTLRPDLPQLVDIFRKHCSIRSVSVPTNGLLPERTASLAREIAGLSPDLQVSFNVSLDGFADTHDRLRGVPGNFKRALETLRLLRESAAHLPNLKVQINTVICADTYPEVVDFARWARSERLSNGHFFEIVRGSPPEERLKQVPASALRDIYTQLLPIQSSYLREGNHQSGILHWWREIEDLGGLIYRYRTQWAAHAESARWAAPCRAGDAIAVIDYDGSLRVCELRNTAVNLRQYDLDFEQARHSPLMLHERAAAASHACDCTHVCFVNTSLRYSLGQRFGKVPLLYARYRLKGTW